MLKKVLFGVVKIPRMKIKFHICFTYIYIYIYILKHTPLDELLSLVIVHTK